MRQLAFGRARLLTVAEWTGAKLSPRHRPRAGCAGRRAALGVPVVRIPRYAYTIRGAHAPSRVPTRALAGRREAFAFSNAFNYFTPRCSARARNTAREGACAPQYVAEVRS